jgi:hypothetical protein
MDSSSYTNYRFTTQAAPLWRFTPLISLLLLALLITACGGDEATALPTATATVQNTTSELVRAVVEDPPTATPRPLSIPRTRPSPAPTPTPYLVAQAKPGLRGHPTLADYWEGEAEWVLEVGNTGLPMGESETIVMSNGELWSYVHASDRSAGVVDQCGDPVPFPGCVVIYRSTDGGYTFTLDEPICQIACNTCPCTSQEDHIDQQQYPRVAWDGDRLWLAYEYRAMIMLAESTDGLDWTPVGQIPATGIWHYWFRECTKAESIGVHPFAPYDYQCLVGGPPGIHEEDGMLYIFVGLGQNPGAMGCFKGPTGSALALFEKCDANPLFGALETYGPLGDSGAAGNPHFDFRTISSADVQKLGDRYYMLYEGVRGPGPGDPGDTQFALGMARTLTDQIDGPWELFSDNPILVDNPGNIGLGHADLVVLDGQTILYTSLDGLVRSRLVLVWR